MLVSPAAANPIPIFDNGPPSYQGGADVVSRRLADDFVFPIDVEIGGVQIWTLEGFGNRAWALPFDGHLDYWIYASDNGHPGELLASGVGQGIQRFPLGPSLGGLEAYDNRFFLQAPFHTEANRPYFLALHMLDDDYPDAEFYWVTARLPLRGGSSHVARLDSEVWNDISQSPSALDGRHHLAFRVYPEGSPVPEPNALCIVLGAIVIVAARKRIRRRWTNPSPR